VRARSAFTGGPKGCTRELIVAYGSRQTRNSRKAFHIDLLTSDALGTKASDNKRWNFDAVETSSVAFSYKFDCF
jgi:hypothetical protein